MYDYYMYMCNKMNVLRDKEIGIVCSILQPPTCKMNYVKMQHN